MIPPAPPLDRRASGVLLHPTSLPSSHGVGDLGPAADEFLAFLSAAKQSWWQMLPLGMPAMGGSPYQVLSAFAGNPLLISLERLADDGLLPRRKVAPVRLGAPQRAAYTRAVLHKEPLLREAYREWVSAGGERRRDYARFGRSNRYWLDDFTLFLSIKRSHKGAAWEKWPAPLRQRKKDAMAAAAREFQEERRFQRFVQFVFSLQWETLRKKAEKRHVRLIGDIPIFIGHDSADVWVHRRLFFLNNAGGPLYVAGTPPDYFSTDGQRWGNPLYRWDVERREGYEWWVQRIRAQFRLVHALRLDHFIGFERYWRIPARDKIARRGRWIPGPGAAFFEAVHRRLGPLPLIAEDLGAVTDEVRALRDQFGFPGMRILQFAFGGDEESNQFLPYRYPANCVVYTGTHDNDTTVGWFRDRGGSSSTRTPKRIRQEKEYALRYMRSSGREIHWDMIRLALSSVANTAIIPAQDLLGLPSSARMNRPGTGSGNWVWRLKPGQLTRSIADRLAHETVTYGRAPAKAFQ